MLRTVSNYLIILQKHPFKTTLYFWAAKDQDRSIALHIGAQKIGLARVQI